jgi:hypothetical protein
MATLAFASVLVGMILGRFFKWTVLVPACGLAVVLVMANPVYADGSPSRILQIVIVIASLQLGYVVRVISPYLFCGPKGLPKYQPKSLLSQKHHL